ncbi:Hypothetical protein Nlim_0789 [Candidatus Nitrosarchaeum limnium SFB1]|uniref:Uncharacterized protein n=1 Tax=Candidatus Nitrosarchaeum limnium SFB1 TaxID=886738 RepID=F3KJY0_9ARCH|nr:Hypothetical protein Nlim_0789 [Candidatus Nitrosarchaeum limnium SFB1]
MCFQILTVADSCVCGHDSHRHFLGSLERFSPYFMHKTPIENRIHCKICQCPKFKKKRLWSNREPYDLRT